MKKINIKHIIKYSGNVITILSILFIIKVAFSFNIDLSIFDNKISLGILAILCSFIMCLSVFIIAYGWKIILSVLSGKNVHYRESLTIYAKANMGKYLPGNVMHYVERNLFAHNLGLSQKAVILSTFTEIFGLCSVCIILGIVIEGKYIFHILETVIRWEFLLIGMILLVVLLFVVLVFWKKIKTFLFEIPWKLFFIAFLKAIPTYFLFVMLGGISLTLILGAENISNMTMNIALKTMTAYTISWVIGFIVPGSPGGIGVREFILLLLLKDVYPENVILACILMHRFISIVGDILAYLITLIWKKSLKYNS